MSIGHFHLFCTVCLYVMKIVNDKFDKFCDAQSLKANTRKQVLQCKSVNTFGRRHDHFPCAPLDINVLSYGRMVILINSVTMAILTYWSQVFIVPKKLLKKVESSCKCFVWIGKSIHSRKAPISWKTFRLPKTWIARLEELYSATMLKQLW